VRYSEVFGVVEPKAGHFTKATPNRSGAEFARMVGTSWSNTRLQKRFTS